MLRNVAVVVLNGFTPFELGVVSEVFGSDRSDDGLPAYDFAVVAAELGPVSSSAGFTLQTEFGLDRLAQADLVVMSAISDEYCAESISFPEPLLDALRATVARGGRVLSVCSGAFALGAAGLLDGRTCTTHWRHAAELARRFPAAAVDPAVLYVDEDPVITSAGTAAGIDACLHLVRKEQGSRVANGIARRMVVPPHRDGGQAQYVDRPLAALSCDTLAGVISWMERHLDRPVSIRQLAARAAMSPRTFARRFVAETGTTPQRWLTGQRILLAQELLEETDETVDLIAERAGFGNATVLRHHFRLWRDTTPNAYRRAFRPAAGSPGPGSPGPRSLQHGSLQHGSLEHGGNGRVAARQLQGVGG
jgi:transcriptional regulator GlxA family with amidase domain